MLLITLKAPGKNVFIQHFFDFKLEVPTNATRQEKERKVAKWIGRNKMVYICRYSNGLSRKCQRIFKITSRAKEQFW